MGRMLSACWNVIWANFPGVLSLLFGLLELMTTLSMGSLRLICFAIS